MPATLSDADMPLMHAAYTVFLENYFNTLGFEGPRALHNVLVAGLSATSQPEPCKQFVQTLLGEDFQYEQTHTRFLEGEQKECGDERLSTASANTADRDEELGATQTPLLDHIPQEDVLPILIVLANLFSVIQGLDKNSQGNIPVVFNNKDQHLFPQQRELLQKEIYRRMNTPAQIGSMNSIAGQTTNPAVKKIQALDLCGLLITVSESESPTNQLTMTGEFYNIFPYFRQDRQNASLGLAIIGSLVVALVLALTFLLRGHDTTGPTKPPTPAPLGGGHPGLNSPT